MASQVEPIYHRKQRDLHLRLVLSVSVHLQGQRSGTQDYTHPECPKHVG